MTTNNLVFENTRFNVVDRNNQIWLTSAEIAQALGYASEKSISNLYARNSDEFTPAMSEVITLMTSGNLQKEVRIFSLRGAHLIGMFAKTVPARRFRKWVLDILDKEALQPAPLSQRNPVTGVVTPFMPVVVDPAVLSPKSGPVRMLITFYPDTRRQYCEVLTRDHYVVKDSDDGSLNRLAMNMSDHAVSPLMASLSRRVRLMADDINSY